LPTRLLNVVLVMGGSAPWAPVHFCQKSRNSLQRILPTQEQKVVFHVL
jgi:hypothetical protein